MAGAVVGSLIFLAGAVFLFLWWRKQQRLHTPAPAETVLNRPDPSEKPCPSPTTQNTVRVYSISSNTTIDLDPESQAGSRRLDSPASSVRSNPFDDNNSIQTAGTEGTNVIPIALVSPDPSSHSQSSQVSSASSPVRPPRPDTSLDNATNAHHDSLRPMPPNYAQSQRSGVSAVSRNSYMSNASYASDFLNEAPIIMTATHGPVRQLLGVSKAEVVSPSNDGLKPLGSGLRPAVSSPLAVTSFGPSDVISEEHNPFNDRHSTATTHATSPATTTFGPSSPSANTHASMQSTQSAWVPDGPLLPWAKNDDDNNSRPSSVSTQAGSLIGFGNATRVNVGLLGRSPSYRTTMGRLVTPSTGGLGTLEEQQQRAMVHNQQRAAMQNKRTSGSSVISATSTRADSILESFPFVPPSPISNRPMRSPPVSPLVQQSFSSSPAPSPKQAPAASHYEAESDLPAPPDRRTLGMSTGSQLSTASSGLGSFPFQIDTGNSMDSQAPSAYSGRQRASLDTLALTSDLSSYPLGFDRDSHVPPVPKT
ncbi:hypothetical protein BDZ89DRAFT_1055845 [Hymenopellis radicata]|nr:hypothetical protein BDZ89DRAFT_1055845 [Hymenopellis radicata]